MECIELLNELKSRAKAEIIPEKTCDTVKCGDVHKDVKKVATTMFATPDVIRSADKWGADLLIVHEPVYYNHFDNERGLFIENEKRKLLEATGMTVFRFHDYAHAMEPDLIYSGQLKYLGIKGTQVKGKYYAVNNFIPDEEITAKKLAELMQNNLGLKNVRIAGNPEAVGGKISCCFGTPGHIVEELAENDIVLTGEICEWEIGEIARDYAQLGYNKAVIVMSHIGSERGGMKLLAEMLNEKSDLEAQYFECGEVYQYV